jgi:hypothetical protein
VPRTLSPVGGRKPIAPDLPEDVRASDLDRAARAPLRTLSKDNADGVARHLVMAGRLFESDPELAYEHAQAAVRRAGRVDVVREAAGLTAYRTGRYAEALRELRTVRRLNGSDEHLALMADCERGLGRPDRALAIAQEESVRSLPAATQVELAIVVSGARLDLGDPAAALAALSTPVVQAATGELADRVREARATVLEASGDSAGADALVATGSGGAELGEDDVVVYDLEDDGGDDELDDGGDDELDHGGDDELDDGVGDELDGRLAVGSDEGDVDRAGDAPTSHGSGVGDGWAGDHAADSGIDR